MQFQLGDRVLHQTRNRPHDSFGLGTVTKIYKLDNGLPVVTVSFDDGSEFDFSDDWRISSSLKIFEDFALINFRLDSLIPV